MTQELQPLSEIVQLLPEDHQKFFVQYITQVINSTFASNQANNPETRFRDTYRQQVAEAEQYFEECRKYFEQHPTYQNVFSEWGAAFGQYAWKVHDLDAGCNVWDFVDVSG